MEKDLQIKIEGNSEKNKIKRLARKFGYAFTGLRRAISNHSSFITHITIGFIVCFLSIIFNISSAEILFVLSAIFTVLIAELVNTAIEESINLFTLEIKRGAMLAKDSSAAAVLLAVIYSIFVAIVIFGPKIFLILTSINK